MMPAANKGVGGDLAAPDVCKMPAPPPVPFIPMPFPNIGLNVMAMPFSLNVFWSYLPALNTISVVPVTMGDEPGILGGMFSGIIKGPDVMIMGNPIVFVNMMPAKNLLTMATGNMMNAFLGFCNIPSVTNVMLTCERAGVPEQGFGGVLDTDALRELDASLNDERPLAAHVDEDGVVYMRLGCFDRLASQRVFNALAPMGEPIEGLVLDLRGNRGGDARAALELADDFVPKGTVLAILDEDDGDETALRARQDHPYTMPLVILVDERSASAAELFAGALQCHGRAVVVGDRTAGKLSAQRVSPSAGSREKRSTYATVAAYRLPNGRVVDGAGLSPDVPLSHMVDPS